MPQDGISISLEGLDSLLAKLSSIEKPELAIRKALRAGGDIINAAIVERAPEKDGTGGTLPEGALKHDIITRVGADAGPCVRMTVSGSGYCWDTNTGVMVFINGVEPTPSILSSNACTNFNSVDGGDVIKLTAVGTTITCYDVTQGTSGTTTDTTYSTGKPGMFTGSYRPADTFVASND